MTDPQPKRKIRFFRFSLKTFLVFVLLSGFVLGYVIPRQQRAKRESRAIQAIQSKFDMAEFHYDYQINEMQDPAAATDVANPTPRWIQKLLGEHTFSTIRQIHLHHDYRPDKGNVVVNLASELKSFQYVESLFTGNRFADFGDLKCLAKMQKLRQLEIDDGSNLTSLVGIENCRKLESLLLRVTAVRSSAPLASLSRLAKAKFLYCYELTELDALASHRNLKHLEILGLTELKSLDFLSKCSSLENLSLCHMPQVAEFDFALIRQNQHLSTLRLGSFSQLTNLHLIAELPQLETLKLEYLDCESGFRTVSVKSNSLKHLSLYCCHGLKFLDGIGALDNLEELEIDWCSKLGKLEALVNLNSLKVLKIRNLSIDYLPKLERFPKLEHLEISDLHNLKDLDDLARLKAPNLKLVTIYECPELEGLHALASLHGVEKFIFRRCSKVNPEHVALLQSRFPNARIETR